MSVSMNPGATVFTRIPSGATSAPTDSWARFWKLGDSGSGTCLTLRLADRGQPSRWRLCLTVSIERVVVVLVELGVVEQRLQAVHDVINDGAAVTDVARRFGVWRQWLSRMFAQRGS